MHFMKKGKMLWFLVFAVMLTGCRKAGKDELIHSTQESSEGQRGQEFSAEFAIDGEKYTVTAVNTMETHMVDNPGKEQSEYYIYQVSLKNENGEILQQFYHDGRDDYAELNCDDLNFDGYPDLEIISCHYADGSACDLYLWEKENQKFSEDEIHISRTYEVHKKQQVFSLVPGGNEIICRLSEQGEIMELRSYTLNTDEKTLRIYDSTEDKFLVYEKIDFNEEGQLINYEDYQEILWSDLPGSDQDIETYWSVDVEDYNVSLMDLVPGESLKLVISKGDHDTTIVKVYRKEADYKSPDEFSIGVFKNLLGHNGFYIYDYFCGQWYLAYYYAVEEDELICLAESWGGGPSDYMVDVDGDGDNELICNVTYLADGGRRTVIYRYDGTQVLQGFLDDLLDEEYDNHGVGSSHSEYLPDKNVVKIWFWKDELEDFAAKEYELEMDKITMYPYGIYKSREKEPDPSQALKEFSGEFISDGRMFTVTAVNTGEIYKEGDAEYTKHQIKLTDEKGNMLQEFSSGVIDDTLKLGFDDLNFDGYPDLQIWYFRWKRGNDLCHLYLWDAHKGMFSEQEINLENNYEIFVDKRAFVLKYSDAGEWKDTICRINGNGEVVKLRSFLLDYEDKTLEIRDCVEDNVLFFSDVSFSGDGSLLNKEYYQEIFWKDLI